MARPKLDKSILNAIKCGPIPKIRDWRSITDHEKLTRAERVMCFIENACVIPEGEFVGKAVRLATFQEAFFYSIYDSKQSIRRAMLSIARKNSKTATIAMMLLAHLVGPEAKQNSQIVSGAQSREQAAQVFNYASKMVQQSEILASIVRIVPSSKRLIGLPMNVEYRALSSQANTSHGLSPVLAILDEVGQIRGPNDDFVDAITTSQGAHEDPLLVFISTQAATDTALFSILLDDAERSGDPKIVSHLYAAHRDAEVEDEEAWKAANPALGLFRNLDDLVEQAKQAKRMPSFENTFRNLCLNQRVSLDAPFVSPSVWKSCNGEVPPFGGNPVWVGLDLSARTDLTAMVIICRIGDAFAVAPHFWTPQQGLADRARRDRAPYEQWVKEGFLYTTPGATVDYEFVATHIAQILEGMNVQAISFDRWRIEEMKREFDRIGFRPKMVEHGQGFKDMSPAIDALEAELINGRVRHGAHPLLTMCAANATIIKDPAGNRKLDKSRETGRIDGIVAMAMAFGASCKQEAPIDIDRFIFNPLYV